MSGASAEPARRGRWRVRLAAVVCSSAVTLVALELAVDRFVPVGGKVYRIDAELLHDAVPKARRVQPMPARHLGEGDSARCLIEIDALGLRRERVRAPDGEGARPRLLVLGDSLVMAENVPVEGTFVVQVGRALDALRGPAAAPVRTLNGGRSGYGPDQALLLLRARLEVLRPDALVFVLCAHNDLGDLARNKLFRLGLDGRLERARPRLGDRIRAEFERRHAAASRPALMRLWHFWRGRAARDPVDVLPDATIDLYLEALDAQYAEHFSLGDPEVVSLFEDVYDADAAVRPGAPSVQAKRRLLVAVLRSVVQVAAEADLPLHFVVVPSAVDVDPTFGLRVDSTRHPGYDPGRLVALMLAAAREAGGEATDLTEVLRTIDGRHFVGGTDVHWNASGQRAAAEALAPVLLERTDFRAALAP